MTIDTLLEALKAFGIGVLGRELWGWEFMVLSMVKGPWFRFKGFYGQGFEFEVPVVRVYASSFNTSTIRFGVMSCISESVLKF